MKTVRYIKRSLLWNPKNINNSSVRTIMSSYTSDHWEESINVALVKLIIYARRFSKNWNRIMFQNRVMLKYYNIAFRYGFANTDLWSIPYVGNNNIDFKSCAVNHGSITMMKYITNYSKYNPYANLKEYYCCDCYEIYKSLLRPIGTLNAKTLTLTLRFTGSRMKKYSCFLSYVLCYVCGTHIVKKAKICQRRYNT